MPLKFEKATAKDLAKFNRLFDDAMNITFDGTEKTKMIGKLTVEEYRHWINDSEIVLMYNRNECIGYAVLSINPYDLEDDEMFINNIFIKESLRRKGFGSKLIAYIEDEAKNRGVTIFSVEAYGAEDEKFWEALNYKYNSELYEYHRVVIKN